jgi:hypothetical protein
VKITSAAFLGLLLATATTFAQPSSKAPWLVHEWGTFTSLQDDRGETLGGINTDDEPVPQFVHRLEDFLLLGPTEVPPVFFQGAPHCHPDVTMRLETPVIYFHPPAGATAHQAIDVQAKFKGGWLSEYYPDAFADAPGLNSPNGFGFRIRFGPLKPDTVSSLDWKNLEVGGDWSMRDTQSHVWTSPRNVQAAEVCATNGEADRFLFYRGVANINAPLKISQRDGKLHFQSQLGPLLAEKGSLAIKSLWLVDIHPNGKVAFRTVPPLTLDGNQDKILAEAGAAFNKSEYRSGNLEKLKTALHQALVANGLFADEADALLSTWEWSYFKSTGMRVFFIVPREWTDFYLPLKISIPAELNRVMVGRIELVTPEQREMLRQISKSSVGEVETAARESRNSYYGAYTNTFLQHRLTPEEMQRVNSGRESLSDAGISSPNLYMSYLRLGRFRNALLLDEAKKHATPGLTNFIDCFGLWGYQVAAATNSPISGTQ